MTALTLTTVTHVLRNDDGRPWPNQIVQFDLGGLVDGAWQKLSLVAVNGDRIDHSTSVRTLPNGSLAIPLYGQDQLAVANTSYRVTFPSKTVVYIIVTTSTPPLPLEPLVTLTPPTLDPIGLFLRYDIAQALTSGQKMQVQTDLGLGNAATKSVGTTAGTVAAGDDSRIVNATTAAAAHTDAAGQITALGLDTEATNRANADTTLTAVATAAQATANAAVKGKACALDGTDGLPAPTGSGLEFVIGTDGLDDIRYNGTSL